MPRIHLRAVVGGVHDDRVLGNAEFVVDVEQAAATVSSRSIIVAW
jgi:hypothetical protein